MSSVYSHASSNPFSDRHAVDYQPPAALSRPPSYTSFDAPSPTGHPPVPAPASTSVAAPIAPPVVPSVARSVADAPVAAPVSAKLPQPRKRAANQGFWRTYTTPGQLLPPKLEPLTAAERASRSSDTSMQVKLQKALLKHTSGVGLAKLGAKVGLLGLAGVGTYFAVTQIIALVHAGVSAKVGAILLPVGLAVAASLLLAVLVYMVVKSFRAMRRDLKSELAAREAPGIELLQPAR